MRSDQIGFVSESLEFTPFISIYYYLKEFMILTRLIESDIIWQERKLKINLSDAKLTTISHIK